MLVTIDNAPGKNLKITKSSTFRNMRFESLSARTLPAEISIKGLKARAGNVDRNRNVIIKVLTRNMPAFGNTPLSYDGGLMNLLKLFIVGLGNAVQLVDLSLRGDDLMKMVWPTLETHTYYETTRSVTMKGKTYKVLRPMNSFGYYLSHDGPNFGYRNFIDGKSAALSTVNGIANLKKMLVPSEGSVTVETRVVAEELPLWLTNMATHD